LAVVLVSLGLLIAVSTWLPGVLPTAMTILHGIWVGRRYRAWRRDRDEDEMRVAERRRQLAEQPELDSAILEGA
jgi:hypothetical protein